MINFIDTKMIKIKVFLNIKRILDLIKFELPLLMDVLILLFALKNLVEPSENQP